MNSDRLRKEYLNQMASLHRIRNHPGLPACLVVGRHGSRISHALTDESKSHTIHLSR